MIILGIDPGSHRTGYGVVRIEGREERLVDYGVIDLTRFRAHAQRIKHIHDRVADLCGEYLPDECALEMPVYGKNPQSMLKLGRAQAAAMLGALGREIPVTEYTPKEVKKAVTGNGNAAKEQVWHMVRRLLGIGDDAPAMGLDASDALAVALCHAHRREAGAQQAYKGWDAFVAANPDRVSGRSA